MQRNVAQLAKDIRERRITSKDLVEACLARIDEAEAEVGAWAAFDPAYAIEQGEERDRQLAASEPVGPLHGIPVGIKDIIETEDFPTEFGTEIMRGNRPTQDATVVASLRTAGAVVMGKTVTAELAVYTPGKTANPHDPARTPGGSSSGSAAAIAASMVPLTVGTQTNGSTIRPAAYCGVYGFKPSHGLISRHGIISQSPRLDQVGVFANNIEDIGYFADLLMRYDSNDPDMRPRSRIDLSQRLQEDTSRAYRFGFVRSPYWHEMDPPAASRLEAFVERNSNYIEEVCLPRIFDDARDVHATIMESDIGFRYSHFLDHPKGKLSAPLEEMVKRGATHSAVSYHHACRARHEMQEKLRELLTDYDAILTPSACGEALVGLESTGSPIFCTTWTLCGVPALNVPLLKGDNGLPLGLQMVGAYGHDDALLDAARWLVENLGRDE